MVPGDAPGHQCCKRDYQGEQTSLTKRLNSDIQIEQHVTEVASLFRVYIAVIRNQNW